MSKVVWLPRKGVAARYGVDPRSISRWEADREMNFPQPTHVNGRSYYAVDELDAFDQRCAAAGRRAAARQGERLAEARRRALEPSEAGEAEAAQ
jgi:hypothetical protein